MFLNKNELTIMYNGDNDKSRKTLSIAKSLHSTINVLDIRKERMSRSLFCFLLYISNITPNELINKKDAYYQSELEKGEYTFVDWFYILKKNPDLFINPLVFYIDRGSVCLTPKDVLKIA
jgi:arsenate reductase-like glutaredoxin family protein